jgi:hypothetical protein
MLKKIFWALVMVTIAACTVLLGEGFSFPFLEPTTTAVVEQTEIPFPTEISVDPTATEIIIPTSDVTEVVPTATEIVIAPTETLEPTAVFTATLIPPTATLVPPTATTKPATATFTPTVIPPTATFTPTAIPPTATSTATAITEKFTIQAATPIFMVNFIHTTEGCNWQGVAGQIFDASGIPLKNYIVKVAGTYNGKPFSQIGYTGMVSGNPYGIGGYEIVLGNSAVASVDLLTIQLFDATGIPVTNPLAFSTSANCAQNLVLINFKAK